MRSRAVGSFGWGMVAAVMLVIGAACSNDSDDNQGSGQGSGGTATGGSPNSGGAAGSTAGGVAGNGGASGTDFQAVAETICLTKLTLNCPNDQASACVATLTDTADLRVQAGCGTQQKVFYDCQAARPASDFTCNNGLATLKPGVCATEEADLGNCTG